MKEELFYYDIDKIIKVINKGKYNSKIDSIFTTALAILTFYITLNKFNIEPPTPKQMKPLIYYTSILNAIAGNVFINWRRKCHNSYYEEHLNILKEFLYVIKGLNINATEEDVLKSIKEKRKYEDLYYLFDAGGNIKIISKIELGKKGKRTQEILYNLVDFNITDVYLEKIDEGTKKTISWYEYKLNYNLDNKPNEINFYLDKNTVNIHQSKGDISKLDDKFKYIYLRIVLGKSKENAKIKEYEQAFKSQIIKKNKK